MAWILGLGGFSFEKDNLLVWHCVSVILRSIDWRPEVRTGK